MLSLLCCYCLTDIPELRDHTCLWDTCKQQGQCQGNGETLSACQSLCMSGSADIRLADMTLEGGLLSEREYLY